MAPAGTPATIIQQMRDALAAVMDETPVKARMYTQGFEPAMDTPAQFCPFIQAERARYGRIIGRRQCVTIAQAKRYLVSGASRPGSGLAVRP